MCESTLVSSRIFKHNSSLSNELIIILNKMSLMFLNEWEMGFIKVMNNTSQNGFAVAKKAMYSNVHLQLQEHVSSAQQKSDISFFDRWELNCSS